MIDCNSIPSFSFRYFQVSYQKLNLISVPSIANDSELNVFCHD